MSTSTDGRRRSRLEPAGPFLVVGDLHNHTTLSDGRGDPEAAFRQMREAGLDVAALTDHASIPRGRRNELGLHQYPDDEALAAARMMPRSFDDDAWRRTGELAERFDVPGVFTALRGFEWTEPWLGHVNVWFSDDWIDVDTPGSMAGLFAFLAEHEPKALFGYNHPGREGGRHEEFVLPPDPADLPARMVALEAFNRADDYLFGLGGADSALVACLDAGWRPGLVGCSDEHGSSFGLAGRGRTGIWVHEHSREGVREALTARRTFATREVGLRLDATLDGVRMGGALSGDHPELAVDLAGSGYEGRPVELQVLTSAAAVGGASPEVAVLERIPAVVGEVAQARIQVPPDAGWVLVRVADPARGYGRWAPAGHPASTWAVAYTSPWLAGYPSSAADSSSVSQAS
ncbi:MAG TPA: DUF3604 domain-containing protein [Kineosporiaceae bacterium]|nr:DUF3604 domain-containing protein [Kineosporiaceae bacterium]